MTDDAWKIAKILGEDNRLAIDNSSADGTVLISADKSTILAEYGGETNLRHSTKRPLKNTTVTINGDLDVELSTDFAGTKVEITGEININGTKFTSAENSQLGILAESYGATLISGTIILAAGENISIGGKNISVDAEITITVENSELTEIGGLDAGETFSVDGDTYKMTALGLIRNGTGILTDSTAEKFTYDLDADDWTTIKIGDAIELDAETDGVTFINSDKTKILATYEVGTFNNLDSDTEISSGGATFKTNTGEISISGNEITGAALSAYEFDSEILTVSATPVGNLGDVVTSGDSSAIVLNEEILMSKIVLVNLSGEKISRVKNGVELTNATVQIVNNSTLKLVEVVGDAIQEVAEIPAAGGVTVSSGMTLELVGLEIDMVEVEFNSTVKLLTDGMTISGATDETFTLGTAGATFTINKLKFTADDDRFTVNPIEPPTLDAEKISLLEGAVEVDSATTVIAGDSDITSLENFTLVVDADGSISKIETDESFEVDGKVYEMTAVGLISGGKLLKLESKVTLDVTSGVTVEVADGSVVGIYGLSDDEC